MSKTVAFISEHASPLATLGGVDSGGQNIYVGELARQLAEMGYRVDVFTRRDNAALPDVVQWVPGVRVIHVEAGPACVLPKEELFPYMDAFADYMQAFIVKQGIRYQLMHANFWMSGYVAMTLKERLHIPFVITFHALGKVRLLHQREHDQFPASRCAIEEQTMRAARWIIAECPQDKHDLMALYHADAEKIAMIPCGFNRHEFQPIDQTYARMLLGLCPTKKTVLQLGRMVPRKGIDNVIRSIALVKDVLPDAQLVVVGGEQEHLDAATDAEYKRLADLTSSLQLTDTVLFAGRKNREQLKYYYAAADVFVSTPWYEPFGITPLEAMACGTPVIGSHVGGIQYSVEHEKTGFLVPPKDPEALAEKLLLLLENGDLRTAMQRNALIRVNEHFTWGKIAKQLDTVYGQVFEEQGMGLAAGHTSFVSRAFGEAADTFRQAAAALTDVVERAGDVLLNTFVNGHKVLVCGNGGSAAESLHFSAELLGRFEAPNRVALPVIALVADTAMLTAWSNDVCFDDVFARQVEAYGQPGDVLLCLSTSGNSTNILAAMDRARRKGMTCMTLLGKDGGKAAEKGDINMVVPSDNTQRIQELHLHIIHLLCSLVEQGLKRRPKHARPLANGIRKNGGALTTPSPVEAIISPYRTNGSEIIYNHIE